MNYMALFFDVHLEIRNQKELRIFLDVQFWLMDWLVLCSRVLVPKNPNQSPVSTP